MPHMVITHYRRWLYLRDLLRALVSRNIKSRYKGSVLGVLWSLVNPLMQLVVFQFIFRSVLQLGIPRYSSFAFSGMLAWTWFQASLLDASGSVINGRELVKRPGFPAAILPVAAVTTHFLYYLMALPILIVFLTVSGVHFTPVILMLPLVVAVQFLLTLSLSYLVAIANIMFRDAQYLLSLVLQLFFFLTPVFYDASAVPQHYQTFYNLNPMAQLVGAYRAILLHGRAPDGWPILVLAILAGALLGWGLCLFKRMSHRLAEDV